MLTLAIEVSNPSSGERASEVGLGVIQDGAARVLGVERVDLGGRDSDDLIPACDRLLGRFNRTPADLGAVAVDRGPGGFTGLRVAIAAASAVAMARQIPLLAVPAARVAASAASDGETGFVVALASKRGTAFVQAIDRLGRPLMDGAILDNEQLSALALPEPQRTWALIVDDHAPEAWRAIARERDWAVRPMRLSSAAVLHVAAAGGEALAVRPEALEPIYAREPEAVTVWRARHQGGPR